ncbi:MAG: hypothetical protein M1820_008696 [Bogoriella megaspora]|nr:MAG: hypothetical protein M1820_008696 [Bogoriella megaspora]
MAPPKCPRAVELNAYPPSRDRSTYDSLVKIVVGKGLRQEEFRVYRGLLCHHSTYFKKALQGNWLEAKNQEFLLDEDDPRVFSAVYNWIFTRRLYDPPQGAQESHKIPIDWKLLFKIYVFSKARGIPGVSYAVIDLLCLKYAEVWQVPCFEIQFLYENTLPDDPARKLVVHFLSQSCSPLDGYLSQNRRNYYHIDFVCDLALELDRMPTPRLLKGKEYWEKVNRCQYHKHEKDEVG